MRLTLIFLSIFLWVTDIYGQPPSPTDANTCLDATYANVQKRTFFFDYKQTPEWKKYKTLKTIGWTAVGVGGFMLTGGCICDILDNYDSAVNIKWRFRIVWIIGAGIAASSIPLLTFAYTNRHKAKKRAAFSLTTSNLLVDLPTGRKQTQPTLGININF